MLRFSFATAVTVTVVAKKLESEKLQSLERVCCGIERVSAGIWRVLHSSCLHGDALPQPHTEKAVIDDVVAVVLVNQLLVDQGCEGGFDAAQCG